jgi:outer membrane receptor protein involved in Fe transport
MSADFFEGISDNDRVNPKLGVMWHPFPSSTLRAALFRVLRRTLIANQTLEPTQVAGFNQFFDDPEGTESWRYGIAWDQQFFPDAFGGVEFTKRDLEVPFNLTNSSDPPEVRSVDWEEYLTRIYIYWTPHRWLAATGEYQYERLERDREFPGPLALTNLDSHQFSLGTSFFHPTGFSAGLKATYFAQDGTFEDPNNVLFDGDDQFWVVDASIGYRLPKRLGLLTLEVRNLFDEEFKFQDTNPANPQIYPERLVFGRITLSF